MVVEYLVEFSEVLPLFYVSIPVIALLVWYKIRSSQQIFKMKERNKNAKKEQRKPKKRKDKKPYGGKTLDSKKI